MEHTTGKLTFRGFSIYAADGKTPVADTCLNASVAQHDVANARRLVACWNACDGVSVEWLEAQADPASEELFGKTAPLDKRLQAAMQDAEAAKAQRDELLDALTNLANTFHEGRATIAQPESAGYVGSVIDAAEALIAKHKGAEHG